MKPRSKVELLLINTLSERYFTAANFFFSNVNIKFDGILPLS